MDTTQAIIDARTTHCAHCGHLGIHVDTTAGEIVVAGEVVAVAPAGQLRLMADEHGELTCDGCQGN